MTKIINQIYKDGMLPALASAIVLSVILSFSNSRKFYFVQNEAQIHHKHYKIIPPSDHLINSGEDYPIHVMVMTPLKATGWAIVPFIVFLFINSVVREFKKNKSGEPEH
ncbi:hypothetical protein [Pontiella desulfatans]|uniref:hypothetical protein n=1 Tax=Pontiella desulfatans TaxID=2750659 RepID=UPI00109CCC07|nr:hypothetical protein [Pontiella desulfatans]